MATDEELRMIATLVDQFSKPLADLKAKLTEI
jgi:hypothetical protein